MTKAEENPRAILSDESCFDFEVESWDGEARNLWRGSFKNVFESMRSL